MIDLLVAFLWYFKKLWILDTGIVSTALLSALSLVVRRMSESDKMSQNISAYIFPFHKIHTPLPLLYKTIYWYSKNIHAEWKMLFYDCVICFSLWGDGLRIAI